ncbi:hypothetical protein WJ70_06350 [Burkholderia ubonensis]|uniref:contractile injection system protein, VgrG/Pvc8 family n=1 Tax=Burkholderia ubonensis TaxID=101571 RepID=UPI000753A44F|nr:contractile injection system protein, VgrG/Pvc8 family [Burkholderia ubonensis]KVN99262.1 hypothetical protein WJ70_06350 [Burkholderia ubonensis]
MNVQNLVAALRGGLIQQDRLLKLDTPLGPNALVVQRAVGHSTIGRDYIFTLDVVSLDSTIELKRLIAQPVTLWIQQASGGYRSIHGYVHTARRLGADGSLATYQITLQAWMYVLTFRRDQRIWTDKMLHHAHIVQISGESYRLKDKRKAEQTSTRAGAKAAA